VSYLPKTIPKLFGQVLYQDCRQMHFGDPKPAPTAIYIVFFGYRNSH